MATQTTNNKSVSLHPSSGAENDSFIGVKIRGNTIDFYYPCAYHFDSNPKEARSEIIAILKTISLAKTNEKSRAEVFTESENETEFALDSYLWVIRDYLVNGLYVNREKALKLNQRGRVNWKRTLDTDPIVSKNGQIIYNDIVVETKSSVENLLVEIHKYCVKKSIDYIGWIFNLSSPFLYTKPFNESVKRQYFSALTKELSHTFEDDKKVRLSHFKNVIQGLDARLEGKDFVYGVKDYDYVFEKMIDSIFGNEDVTNFYPKGQWFLVKNSFKPTNSRELRPDTILSDGKDVYILDSKNYRYGVTDVEGHLPETSSIQKQIVYGDFVESNLGSRFEHVYNAFLLPYDKLKNKFGANSDLLYIGYAKIDSNTGKKSHESVHTFLIDLKHVVDSWNRANHKDDRERLIEEIQKAVALTQQNTTPQSIPPSGS